MLDDLTPEQRELAEYMKELSEKAYCAAWHDGLEYALWEVVIGRRDHHGWFQFQQVHRAMLRHLSDSCGGWIVFDDEDKETFVPISRWERQFSKAKFTDL